MTDWIPLYVAIVGAAAAIGVAFWNSRGDFGELRQLKALNDVLPGLPEGLEKLLLERTRDVLVARVAKRIAGAPGRRRLVWIIVGAIAVTALVLGAVVALAPSLANSDLLNAIATGVPALLAILGSAIGYLSAERADKKSRDALKEADRAARRPNDENRD